MSRKWKKTEHAGVYFREHPHRKNGVGADLYYAIFYKFKGKTICEVLGWGSEGWTESKASELYGTLKYNRRYGSGPQTLKELKILASQRQEEERHNALEAEKQRISLNNYWAEHYCTFAKNIKKSVSFEKEQSHFKCWLSPQLGNKAISQITIEDWDSLMRLFAATGLKPRTKEYITGTLRRVLRHAQYRGLKVYIPSGKQIGATPCKDNRRMRIITLQEQKNILNFLLMLNIRAHNIAFFAFLTGCRFSEAAKLVWGQVDLDSHPGSLTFRKTKNSDTRTLQISSSLRSFLKSLSRAGPTSLVFPRSDGNIYREPPSSFALAVKHLGLNEGRDEYDRISFHSIRHTVATRLASYLDLRSLMDIMGWKTASMAARYIKSDQQNKLNALEQL